MARTRRSLADDGPAHWLVVSLAEADERALRALAHRWRCSPAEAVRRLIRGER